MIGRLQGQFAFGRKEGIIYIFCGGVGYEVRVTKETENILRGKIADDLDFWIHTSVRETAIDLYGFLNEEDLSMFELLLGVPGIGPRSAITIMGETSVDSLYQAIAQGDSGYLTKISGIGKKSAEKIVVELRDKILKLGITKDNVHIQNETDIVEALKSLGFKPQDIREVIKKIPRHIVSIEEKITIALKELK